MRLYRESNAGSPTKLPLVSRGSARSGRGCALRRPDASSVHVHHAFTLLEVMIACAIFFMVAFAILGMVTGGLAQAKALQQRDPDAGILAATLSLTNQLEEGVESGTFEDLAPGLYRGYRWTREVNEVGSNGLFQVDFIVQGNFGKHRSSETRLSVLMFRPGSKPGKAFGTGVGR
jgi:hypothetical protein